MIGRLKGYVLVTKLCRLVVLIVSSWFATALILMIGFDITHSVFVSVPALSFREAFRLVPVVWLLRLLFGSEFEVTKKTSTF